MVFAELTDKSPNRICLVEVLGFYDHKNSCEMFPKDIDQFLKEYITDSQSSPMVIIVPEYIWGTGTQISNRINLNYVRQIWEE